MIASITLDRIFEPKAKYSRMIWIGIDATYTANRKPLVFSDDHVCAMDHRTRGGPPMPQIPANRPLATKESPAQLSASSPRVEVSKKIAPQPEGRACSRRLF